ncbi:MbnH family di-heme enzyme [Gemmatimonadota bacterium DH-20]|uniref:MbnH family di-heme enzyme n=1 Tax=Gaopeijia maritima TaxID=3119007 RepID=A0ABU9ECU9_9BACT
MTFRGAGFRLGLVAIGCLAAPGLGLSSSLQLPEWDWGLPPGIPAPRVPADNPMSAEKVELGRHLFYDTRLSGNETQSCATCHQQARAFADPRPRGVGSTGEVHPRGSMSLANVAWVSALTWAHPTLSSLEEQQIAPLFGTDPVELGLEGREQEMLDRLRASSVYPEMFAAAFPAREDPITLVSVLEAIATFERTLVSFDSPWDRTTYRGERGLLSDEARLGAELFFSVRTGCADCHGAPFFTGSVDHVEADGPVREFFNTGLHDLDGRGAYPDRNTGIHAITGDPADMGKMRAPTLRNIAVTAPYMHDGSIGTLDEVLRDHYELGGRTGSPLTDRLVVRFGLSTTERRALIAFMESLTDSTFLTDPRFSDPWVGRTVR